MLIFKTQKWLVFSLINLCIISSLGVLLRYKIGSSFPYFNQKDIHHAHSHFAFLGWITHTLYVLMVDYLQSKSASISIKKFNVIILSNLLGAYGLLLSFFFSGYSPVSIILLNGSIVLAVVFAFHFLKETKKIEEERPLLPWFKAGLWFNLISSAGTFYLAYMLISRNFNENLYLSAEYFYLHFQYNGFFIFCCMGLAFHLAQRMIPAYRYNTTIFKIFFASVVPAYFLSVLWLGLPIWLYILVFAAAFAQLWGWYLFYRNMSSQFAVKGGRYSVEKILFIFVSVAFTIKLFLQMGSTIPYVSHLAFGFRPIVIAYLHLVLLAIISVFLLSYIYAFQLVQVNKKLTIGLTVFISGIFLNELALAIQGIASFSYFPIPYVNDVLFGIALLLWMGTALMLISQYRTTYAVK